MAGKQPQKRPNNKEDLVEEKP
jgi:hypothetical protein